MHIAVLIHIIRLYFFETQTRVGGIMIREHFFQFISDYGYLALYITFSFGLLGLPIPDETILTYVGFLVYGGHLDYLKAIIISFFGSLTGMCLSYAIGRHYGKPFLMRYGKWIYLTPQRLSKTERWFHKFGPWTIVFGYYVPGVRHLTCYMAGISHIALWRYILYAGSGALVWCFTFITLGYVIGFQWERVMHQIEGYMRWVIFGAIVLGAIVIFFWWRYKKRKLIP
jgi:membrane protein DedA with SNARE-associated domain